jgi:HPt (histidine-containing phosphotransfer) domain-containing protein
MTKRYDLTNLELVADGDESFVQDMIDVFLVSVPESLKAINVAYRGQDWDELKARAHKLKPTIDLMGVSDLKDTIRIIDDRAGEQEDLESLEPEIEKLNEILGEAIEQVTALKG